MVVGGAVHDVEPRGVRRSGGEHGHTGRGSEDPPGRARCPLLAPERCGRRGQRSQLSHEPLIGFEDGDLSAEG